ncbi:MAG: SIS domain-containing protein [Deltaproteobacteria bacterium]|nr:MAG: SIS domain-containing protein [Deltaproteobacteria bacterium]
MKPWDLSASELKACLDSLSVWDASGAVLEPDASFSRLREVTLRLSKNGNIIYLIGNGASASMASHISADLAKNAHLHTMVFTDLSLITACANDLCYEEVFADPLRRQMKKGDMLVAISSSGQSANILRAAQVAGKLGGLVITLSAMKPDNPLRTMGAYNFYVPAGTYGLAETSHAAILHFWVDQMVTVMRQP